MFPTHHHVFAIQNLGFSELVQAVFDVKSVLNWLAVTLPARTALEWLRTLTNQKQELMKVPICAHLKLNISSKT